MALIAGVDIGNSTTEIVIADGETPVASERRPTRGAKGSEASVRAAAALLRSMQRGAGLDIERVVVAPWHPVTTEVATLHDPPPDSGAIRIIDCADHSVVGNAWAAGIPWNLSADPPAGVPLVAVVEAGSGYRRAAERINRAIERGAAVTGVVVGDDEAVLIAARLAADLPVLDRVDCALALRARKLYVEVRPAGQCVNTATDAWALDEAFQLRGRQSEAVNLVCRWVRDSRAVIIGLFDAPVEPSPRQAAPSLTLRSGEIVGLVDGVSRLADLPVGAVASLNLQDPITTSDVWGIDIDDVLVARGIRKTGHSSRIALASLTAVENKPRFDLSSIFEIPVTVASSESDATSVGARTTPGLADEALILDIGGGTIDLVAGEIRISAAGAGDLLSAAVAEVLDVPRAAAEWIKRGPAQRVDSAAVRLSENGSFDFVADSEPAAPANALGRLIVPGPAGPLPFGRNLQPAEWRIMRQSLKLEVIARNVSRILRSYRDRSGLAQNLDLVIVGGPAEDDELLPVLGRLPEVRGLGRGNVAGILGPRYAVAYGLARALQA